MVAYNLLLSLFPVALIALFIAGRVLRSEEITQSVLADLQKLFPSATESDLRSALRSLRSSSRTVGRPRARRQRVGRLDVLGRAGHGVLPHLPPAVPLVGAPEALRARDARRGADVLRRERRGPGGAGPLGRQRARPAARPQPRARPRLRRSLAASLVLLFAMLCLIYWRVPKGRSRGRACGRARWARRSAMAAVDWLFPLYLAEASTLRTVRGVVVFVLIALIWCWALSLILLSGAVVNELRFEARRASRFAMSASDLPEPVRSSPG